MPIFRIEKDTTQFPPAQFADSEGLLCEGGGLSPDQLVNAYKSGLFFWFHPMQYIKWWSPDPRIVLVPEELSVPGFLQKQMHEKGLSVIFGQKPERMLRLCMQVFNEGEMSPAWVTERTIRVFNALSEAGLMQVAEVYKDGELTGGIAGVRIGHVFFSEFICETESPAREFALARMAEKLGKEGVELIDLHKETNETADIGLREMSRNEYLATVKDLTA